MTVPTQPTLEAPTADWLVYGDALQEAGDARGEVIALHNAILESQEEPKCIAKRDEFVRTHGHSRT